MSTPRSGARRPRNPRGQGPRLREEILRAGLELLEVTGSPDAVTLRAVAREVGIAAPSIYGHFPDRDAMHDAMRGAGFEELIAGIYRATDPIDPEDPVRRLRTGCRAYLSFAAERPELYRFMFGPEPLEAEDGTAGPAPSLHTAPGAGPEDPCPPGEMAFRILVEGVAECARRGRSASRDPFADAANLWVAMHGLATLRAAHPDFPWPPYEQQVDQLVSALARLDD
ncbi:MAG TPA: TetR/AcrR family transcriptional regulator [Acidimicrobiales bacterium]|nr:TetR/AcrR family transcriptional regulator [Acidimicrobiales bacterium]